MRTYDPRIDDFDDEGNDLPVCATCGAEISNEALYERYGDEDRGIPLDVPDVIYCDACLAMRTATHGPQ